MKLTCNLRDKLKELQMSEKAFAKEVDLDPRTVKKLCDPDADFRVGKSNLTKLYAFARRHDFTLFEVEPHAIWRHFEKNPTLILRGEKPADTEVEALMSRFLRLKLGADLATRTGLSDIDEVRRQMLSKNCLILGSPKGNPASEIALSLLWEAEPFSAAKANRDRVPIHFCGMKPKPGSRESTLLRDGDFFGLDVKVPSRERRQRVPVDWIPEERYWEAEEEMMDCAAIVACARPLGTEEDVTTIVIAGFSALATLIAAEKATSEELPIARAHMKKSGKPVFALLRFRCLKNAVARITGRNPRAVLHNTCRWGPPWPVFFSE